jgi:hypothetical protein
MNVYCSIDLEWRASDNVGSVATWDENVPYSTLGPRAGGDRSSPEGLLIAALGVSYSITLSSVLRTALLPRTRISVHVDGVIATDRGQGTIYPRDCESSHPRREYLPARRLRKGSPHGARRLPNRPVGTRQRRLHHW